jgi:pimeloyl-ACP methyl ester carboxylesterase
MQYVGTPAEQIQAMRQTPAWPALEAIAPTLAYDHTYIIGKDRSVPVERAAQVRVPTLVMNGSASLPFMYETARMLSNAIPHAEHLTLEGQTHGPAIDVLVPVLTEFFLG